MDDFEGMRMKKITDKEWEMMDKGMCYYCDKCEDTHLTDSDIGKEHWRFKRFFSSGIISDRY